MSPKMVSMPENMAAATPEQLREPILIFRRCGMAPPDGLEPPISPATIRRWCRQRQLAAFQVGTGAAIRIPADQLRDLLARRES